MPLCFCQWTWAAYSALPLDFSRTLECECLLKWKNYLPDSVNTVSELVCLLVDLLSLKTCIHNFFSWFYFSFPPSSIISYAYMKSNSHHKNWQTWDFFLIVVYLLLANWNYNINEKLYKELRLLNLFFYCAGTHSLPFLRQPWKRNHVQDTVDQPGGNRNHSGICCSFAFQACSSLDEQAPFGVSWHLFAF